MSIDPIASFGVFGRLSTAGRGQRACHRPANILFFAITRVIWLSGIEIRRQTCI